MGLREFKQKPGGLINILPIIGLFIFKEIMENGLRTLNMGVQDQEEKQLGRVESISVQDLLDSNINTSDIRTNENIARQYQRFTKDKLSQILNYILVEPTNPEDKKESFK